MTEEMRKNMDEARAQLAQVEADRAAKEEFKKQGGRESFALGGDSAELYYAAQDQGKNAVKTGNVEDAKDAGSWAGQVVQYNDRLTNSGASIANEEIERRRARRELDSGYDSKRDELRTRYRNASTDDERNAIRAEGNEFLKGRKENQNIVAIIDDQYQKDYDAINARVQRGEISPFEAKALHDELRAKREAKIKRETGVDLAFQRAQKQQQEDEARLMEMKDRMGQTTYTLFKAMDRTRDPSLSNEERAAAMQVAGEAATQMGQDFLENKFGPNSGYKSQVQVINDENPATGMKEVAYRVTFTDANGKPVADPKTGKPLEIKFDTARVKTALKDHYGFEDVTDSQGNTSFADSNGKYEDIETGEGLYGGKRSLKMQAAFDEKRDRETKEWVTATTGEVLTMEPGKERDALVTELIKKDPAAGSKVRDYFTARAEAEKKEKQQEETKTAIGNVMDAFDSSGGDLNSESVKTALKTLRGLDPQLAWSVRDGLEKRKKGMEAEEAARLQEDASKDAAEVMAAMLAGANMDTWEWVDPNDPDHKRSFNAVMDDISAGDPRQLPQIIELKNKMDSIRKAKEKDAKLAPLIETYMNADLSEEERVKALGQVILLDRKTADNLMSYERMRQAALKNANAGESYFFANSGEGGTANPSTSATNSGYMGTGGGAKPWSTKPGAAG